MAGVQAGAEGGRRHEGRSRQPQITQPYEKTRHYMQRHVFVDGSYIVRENTNTTVCTVVCWCFRGR